MGSVTILPRLRLAESGAVSMANVLASWKEIAQYLGKGVRTVQRWERTLSFPIHRPNPSGIAIAIPEEVDAWIRSRQSQSLSNGQCESELARLRGIVDELQAENQDLRHQLEAMHTETPAIR
jgi:hypothetical protein